MSKPKSMLDIVRGSRNSAHSHHFFDADTVKFFQTRTSEYTYAWGDNATIFITSEKLGSGPRHYTIRLYNHVTHEISNLLGFQDYETLTRAKRAAERLSAQRENK